MTNLSMDNPWVLLLRGLRQAQFQERQENKEQLKDNHVVRVSRPAKRHSARKPAQGHTCGDTHDPTPPSHSNPDSLAFLLVKKYYSDDPLLSWDIELRRRSQSRPALLLEITIAYICRYILCILYIYMHYADILYILIRQGSRIKKDLSSRYISIVRSWKAAVCCCLRGRSSSIWHLWHMGPASSPYIHSHSDAILLLLFLLL